MPAPATHPDLQRTLGELRRNWGIEFGAVRKVAAELCTGARTVADLVAASGLSRRSVEGILDALVPFLDRSADAHALHRDLVAEATAALRADPPPAEADILERLRTLAKSRPAPDWRLDHVAATPETALKRALYMRDEFDLGCARVLMLGDHDMTSVALALACPEAQVTVVDIDERILTFLQTVRRDQSLPITPLFADLRVHLPRSLASAFDLVFTDPPYSVEGVRLFLQRAVQALKDVDRTRILLAHGVGDRQPALAYKAQSVMHELRLVHRAMLRGFNRYLGAEAIGARSDLHVLQATRRSPAAARRTPPAVAIYSKGPEAAGTDARGVPERLLAECGMDLTDCLLVGEPVPGLDQVQRVSIDTFVRERAVNARAERPVLVNAYPHHDAWLPRLCLHARARTVTLIGSWRGVRNLDGHTWGGLLEAGGLHAAWRYQDGNVAAVTLTRSEDREPSPLARMVSKPGARLGAAWRDALTRHFRVRGRTVTRNEARAAIAASDIGARYAGHHLIELPAEALARLPGEVAESVRALERQPPPG